MKKYKPKGSDVHAIQVEADHNTLSVIINLCVPNCTWGPPGALFVTLKDGSKAVANPGSYVVRDRHNDYHVMSEKEFLDQFEPC